MKKVILIATVFLGIATTKGYSQDTAKTLFHVPKINKIGVYIAPEYQYGQLKNQFTDFGGISGMLLLNKTFAIGGSMYSSMDRNFSPSGVSPLVLHARYGGLKLEYLEYTLNPNSLVHISFPLLIGGGTANMDSANYTALPRRDSLDRRNQLSRPRGLQNNFFIIQPGVQIETNLFKMVKLYAGVNYRFVAADRLTNLPMNTMQGFSAMAGLKIGLFGIPVRKSIQ